MYIIQAYKSLHEWWRYLIGLFIIIGAVIIGQLPFTFAAFYKAYQEGMNFYEMEEQQLMTVLEPNLNLALMLLSFAVGLLGVFLVAKYLHKQPISQLTTARPKIDWKRVWFAFIFWGIVSTGLILIDMQMTPDDYVLNFKLGPFLILVVIAIVFIPLQTSFEEYLFRGYLMQGIGIMTKSKWIPLLVTSVIFGLLHIANPEIEQLGYILLVYYIGTGLFLGIITLMDDGLELALGFHAANNLFTALLVTAEWTAFQTHSVYKDISEPEKAGFIDVFLPVFIVFPMLLYIFSRIYNWSNWKEKLFGKVEPPIDPSDLDEIGM